MPYLLPIKYFLFDFQNLTNVSAILGYLNAETYPNDDLLQSKEKFLKV